MDQEGTKNSEIRYEIIHGNYEKKFFIDSISGQISVMEPLTPGLIRNGRQANFSSKIQRISKNILTKHFEQEGVKLIWLTYVLGSSNIEPVISLTVRAYDLGIPSLDSEVLVHIFTEQTSSRTMKFIVYEDPLMLQDKKDDFSNLFSAMTGGEAEIQDIQAYSDSNSIDRMDYLQIDYINRWVAKNLLWDATYVSMEQ